MADSISRVKLTPGRTYLLEVGELLDQVVAGTATIGTPKLTDAMIEDAARQLFGELMVGNLGYFKASELPGTVQEDLRNAARKVVEAALGQRDLPAPPAAVAAPPLTDESKADLRREFLEKMNAAQQEAGAAEARALADASDPAFEEKVFAPGVEDA